jgi:hypothetical protein
MMRTRECGVPCGHNFGTAQDNDMIQTPISFFFQAPLSVGLTFSLSSVWETSYYPEKYCTSYLAGYLHKNFLGPISLSFLENIQTANRYLRPSGLRSMHLLKYHACQDFSLQCYV